MIIFVAGCITGIALALGFHPMRAWYRWQQIAMRARQDDE